MKDPMQPADVMRAWFRRVRERDSRMAAMGSMPADVLARAGAGGRLAGNARRC